jgi:hypothetical protein
MTATSVPVAVLNLALKKGSKVVQPIEVAINGVLTPLPGGTLAKMQVRADVSSNVVLLELTTENGGILVDAPGAIVTITMTSAITKALVFERAVYDLTLIYPDAEEETIVEGKIYAYPSVTR